MLYLLENKVLKGILFSLLHYELWFLQFVLFYILSLNYIYYGYESCSRL